jgi:NAD(P)-dependent dehydrogenase (short-subunit alcohol dehydrogenase family)
MSNRTWFITGASRGFGRSFAQAALTAGDRVAATARDTSTLDDLAAQYGDAVVPVELDVTDRDAAFAAVGEARERLGRLDVVVNNAGYGVSGAIEELSEEQARRQIEAIAERRSAQQEENNGSQPGNPDLAAQALLDTLDRDDPPFRLLLGKSRLEEFRAGEAVARGADDR